MRFYEKHGFWATGKVDDFFGMPLFEYRKQIGKVSRSLKSQAGMFEHGRCRATQFLPPPSDGPITKGLRPSTVAHFQRAARLTGNRKLASSFFTYFALSSFHPP